MTQSMSRPERFSAAISSCHLCSSERSEPDGNAIRDGTHIGAAYMI